MLGEAVTIALTVTFDPTIRGILVVLVAFLVLCGSVYLVLWTNLGSRLGFLVAAAAFWGWMTIMGAAWWVYGIGYQGPAPAWVVEEVVTSSSPKDTSGAALPEARDLSSGWERLEEGDTRRGEAQASADEALTGEGSPLATFEDANAYVTVDAYARGGKDLGSLVSRLPLSHPPQHAVIQVQKAVEVVTIQEGDTCPPDARCIQFGETPPPSEPDPDAPVLSVVMVRDLGALRLPPALITLSSMAVFGIICNVLHRRDKLATAHRQQARTGS